MDHDYYWRVIWWWKGEAPSSVRRYAVYNGSDIGQNSYCSETYYFKYCYINNLIKGGRYHFFVYAFTSGSTYVAVADTELEFIESKKDVHYH